MATIQIAGAVTLLNSELRYSGDSISSDLLSDGVTIKTPIGSFSRLGEQWLPHASQPPWWSERYTVQAPEPGIPWVRQIDHPIRFDQVNKNGRYATPVEGIALSTDWTEAQLKGTPHDWVHLSLAGSKRGYWVDPSVLQEVQLLTPEDR